MVIFTLSNDYAPRSTASAGCACRHTGVGSESPSPIRASVLGDVVSIAAHRGVLLRDHLWERSSSSQAEPEGFRRQQESSAIGLCWGREEKKSLCADGGERVSRWEMKKRGFSTGDALRCRNPLAQSILCPTLGRKTPGGSELSRGSVGFPYSPTKALRRNWKGFSKRGFAGNGAVRRSSELCLFPPLLHCPLVTWGLSPPPTPCADPSPNNPTPSISHPTGTQHTKRGTANPPGQRAQKEMQGWKIPLHN